MSAEQAFSGMDPDKVLDLANRCIGAAAMVRDASSNVNSNLARVHPGEPAPYLTVLNDFATWLEQSATDLTNRAKAISVIQAVDRIPFVHLGNVVPLPAHRFPSKAAAEAKVDELLGKKKFKPGDYIEDPGKLEKLSREVAKYATDPNFAAAFVKRFGAERLVEVPRTLQFWEFQRAMTGTTSGAYHEHHRHNKKWMKDDPEDVQGILYAFSAVLATATRSADASVKKVVTNVAKDDDAVALSWLMSPDDLVFGTDFLLNAFRNGVVNRIVEENLNANNTHYQESYPLGAMRDRGLPLDPKVKILEALSRNSEAALEAVEMSFKPARTVKLSTSSGPRESKVHTAVGLLLGHGTYGDQGLAVGSVLAAANQHLHDLATAAGATAARAEDYFTQANELTLRMAHEVIRGRKEIDRVIVGLTDVLTKHHMVDLHKAVKKGEDEDFGIDPSSLSETTMQAKLIGEATGQEILLSRAQVEQLLTAVCGQPDAEAAFVEAAARYQASVIVANLNPEKPAGPAGTNHWAAELGMYIGASVNAAGNAAFAEHESELARQKRKLAVFDTVMTLLPMALPALGAAKAGVAVGKFFEAAKLPALDVEAQIKDAIAPEPTREKPLADLNEFKEEASESLRAVLAATALETGMLGDKMAVKAGVEVKLTELAQRRGDKNLHSFFNADGSLLPIGSLDGFQRQALRDWMYDPAVTQAIGPIAIDVNVEMLVKLKEF